MISSTESALGSWQFVIHSIKTEFTFGLRETQMRDIFLCLVLYLSPRIHFSGCYNPPNVKRNDQTVSFPPNSYPFIATSSRNYLSMPKWEALQNVYNAIRVAKFKSVSLSAYYLVSHFWNSLLFYLPSFLSPCISCSFWACLTFPFLTNVHILVS